MKLNMKMLVIAACALMAVGCGGLNKLKPESDVPSTSQPTLQQLIDAEVKKVRISVPDKETMTKGEVVQAKLSASGYDPSYAIKYQQLTADPQKNSVTIVFFLKKDGIVSKQMKVSIDGFKADDNVLSDQEKINEEVDKVEVDVKNKAEITADVLKEENLSFSAYDLQAYTINCKTIKTDGSKKEAEVTFFLFKKENTAVKSKERTVKIEGFKEKIVLPTTIDVTEQEVLRLFQLTETKITASAAAKTIEAAKGETIAGYLFEEAIAVAYDDAAGSFTVIIKGKKDGKIFNKELTVQGFSHPYAKQIWGIDKSGNKGELNLAVGIEDNLSIEKFVEKANANGSTKIKDFFVNTLAFSLVDTNGFAPNIELGETDEYSLTAELKEEGNDKIKILPKYLVKMRKKEVGGREIIETNDYYSSFHNVANSLVKNYFKVDDVLRYVLNKTNDNFVTVDTNTFASYHYAMAKFSGTTCVNFDMTQIQKYVDLYKTNSSDKYLQLEIVAGINNPQGGGISANDFTGELTVDYCIATTEQLVQQSGINYSKRVVRNGFQKIENAQDVNKHFIFTVNIVPLNQVNKDAWKKRFLDNARLFYLDESRNPPSPIITNPLQRYKDRTGAEKAYYLTVNAEQEVGLVFGSGNYGLSKDVQDRQLYIENIILNKRVNSNVLEVTMQLCGGEQINIPIQPFLGHQ